MEEAITALLNLVKEASPAILAAAHQQLALDIRELWIWGVFCGILAVAFGIWAIVLCVKAGYDSDYSGTAFMAFLSAIPLLVTIGCYIALYNRYHNPTWYVIKILVGLVGGD